MNKTVINLTAPEAKKYLLNQEAYFNNDLPPYFDFTTLLTRLSNIINNYDHNNIFHRNIAKNIKTFNDINYQLILNKDGRLGWRSVELIHPVLYVALIHLICEEQHWCDIQNRFHYFKKQSFIECCSLPVIPNKNEKSKAKQIHYWWSKFEQQSISLSLDFNYILQTDVSNCYSSIYTHSIAWALHNKEFCKANLANKKPQKLLGDKIDQHIQWGRYGQTNGIPQGSILMDLIAELVLGYVDTLITEQIQKNYNYQTNKMKILRYRDDYRIFTNNAVDAEQILQIISTELRSVGMSLNISKTNISHDVIQSSIKKDKLVLIQSPDFETLNTKTLQKKLLFCYMFSIQYPNSGSLIILLTKLHQTYLSEKKKISSKIIKEISQNYKSLIAITTNIAVTSPRTFQQVAVIISSLFNYIKPNINKKDIQNIWNQTVKKINQIPNNGYFEIWLQRIAIPNKLVFTSDEKLCQIIDDNNTLIIWNNNWIEHIENKKLRNAINNIINKTDIINKNEMKNLSKTIQPKEVELFKRNYY